MATLANGDWVPDDHPQAQGALKPADPNAGSRTLAGPQVNTATGSILPTTATGTRTTAAAPAAPDPADPFGGNGVKLANGDWVPKDHPLAQGAGATQPAQSGTGTGPQTTTSALNGPVTPGAQTPQGQPTSVAGAFQQALVNRLAPGPVNAQAPEIAGAIGANRGAEQRGFERNRAMMAERAGSQGLDQNAFNSQVTGLAQERAGREGQFEGQMTRELAQQRAQELTSALSLGGAMLSEQDKMALQKELAQLQAQLTREGTAAQVGLGQGDLSLRDKLGSGQLNLGLLNALLGNQQFGQNLGANLGMFSAGLNQKTISELLGGIGG
jgi:hypothetical protein